MTPRQYAAVVFIAILPLVWQTDGVARRAHLTTLRAEIAADAAATARDLSDLIARDTAAVNTLAAFVDITEHHPEDLDEEFETFAAPLHAAGESIQSVQLAPDSVIEYVYPVAGNEAAVGLDLLADPDRRALLEPSIETGATVVQGPVDLVQGGMGVLVRRPIYNSDRSFYGFAAILLNWDRVMEASGIGEAGEDRITGTRVAGTDRVIAGEAAAFEGDPEIAQLQVGPTETFWEVALRPAAGWPALAPTTTFIWVVGLIVATLAALFTHSMTKAPHALRRERERVLKEMAFVEARYRATFTHAAVGVMISDASGRILSANPAMHRIAGYTGDDSLKGSNTLQLLHDDALEEQRSWSSRLRHQSRPVEAEVRLRGEDERWARVIVTRIAGFKDDELFVNVVEDVTDRREAERELGESEARFRQLFEQAPIAIQREDYTLALEEFDRLRRQGMSDLHQYLKDHPDRLRQILGMVKILDANPASNRLQGHLDRPEGERTLLDRLTEPAHETFTETLVAVWEGRPSLEQSVETMGPDGRPLFLDVRWSAPMESGAPDYSRIMVTISDITELREAQQRLEALIESKDRFVASVAHELRTPLTAVVGFAEELKDDLQLYSDREKDEFRELIALHSGELSNIIDDLLVWARADVGEVKVNPVPLDLGASVRTSLTAVTGLRVEVEEPDGVVEAMADPTRLRQIVRNLATNALRYGGEDIDIRVRTMNGHAVIDVSDNGPLLRESDRRRIFEPYARSDTARAAPGSIGLGLSVSLSLARLQGGDLVCVPENGRNVFRVILPTTREQTLVDA